MRFSSFPCLVHILSVLTVINPIRASFNRRDGTCNGHAELCERSYANVTFVGEFFITPVRIGPRADDILRVQVLTIVMPSEPIIVCELPIALIRKLIQPSGCQPRRRWYDACNSGTFKS
jgi:hypothetical protein